MPVTEDIIIVVIAEVLLLLGIEHQFFLVLAFVGAWMRQFLQAAFLSPLVSEMVAPPRRQAAETRLQERRMKNASQEYEAFDFLHDRLWIERLPVGLQILEMDKIRAANGITYVIDRNNADEFIEAIRAGEFYKHRWTLTLESYEWYRDLNAKEFEVLQHETMNVDNKPYEIIEMRSAAVRSKQCH